MQHLSEWMEIYGIFQNWLIHVEQENKRIQQQILTQQAVIDTNIDQLQILLNKLDQIDQRINRVITPSRHYLKEDS